MGTFMNYFFKIETQLLSYQGCPSYALDTQQYKTIRR